MESIEQLRTELEKKKSEYLQLLQTLIVIPEQSSGYYPPSAQTQLYAAEGKIKMLSSALGISENGWCKTEKNNILKKYYKDTAGLTKRNRKAAAIGAAAVIIGLIVFVNYLSSLGDMNRFDDNIQKGDKFFAEGKYCNAIDNYSEAYTNYDGFNSGSYKENAFSKIESATTKLMDEANSDNKALYMLRQSVDNLLKLNLKTSDKKKITAKSELIKSEIEKRVTNGHNTLIGSISANNGRLDESSKKLLDELLWLSPDDYWLNFIKNKENE